MMLKHLLAFSRHRTTSVNQITALLADCWERRGGEGGRRGQSCLFVLPYRSDKINSSCSLWQKTTLWPKHTYTLAPFRPCYAHLLVPLVIRMVAGDLLPYTASKQRCLGCLQWSGKDIKKPSITQINWANGKCDSRTAAVLFTTRSHLQAKEQKITGLWKHW